MVTQTDNEVGPEVVAVLEEFGADAVFTVETTAAEEGYDPSSGNVTAPATTLVTVKISPPFPFAKDLIDGDLILATDLKTLIAGKDAPFIPKEAQLMTFKDQQYTIISVDPIHSGELVAAFELQLRAINAN